MINNPSTAPSAKTSPVARAIWAAMQTQSANNAKNFITKMAKEETAASLQKGVDIGEFAVGVREMDNFTFLYRVTIRNYYASFCSYCSNSLPMLSLVTIFLLLIFPFIDCLQVIYFSFRVWMCHCSRKHMMVPNLISCSPTLPTAETCSN